MEPDSALAIIQLRLYSGLLERIRAAGIKTCCVTLHVGLGTFRPVKAEDIQRIDENISPPGTFRYGSVLCRKTFYSAARSGSNTNNPSAAALCLIDDVCGFPGDHEILEQLGRMPLPPYIKAELSDQERYQTVYDGV